MAHRVGAVATADFFLRLGFLVGVDLAPGVRFRKRPLRFRSQGAALFFRGPARLLRFIVLRVVFGAYGHNILPAMCYVTALRRAASVPIIKQSAWMMESVHGGAVCM